MRYSQPLKRILIATRTHWDRPQVRPAVRENFEKIINCRTPALGGEVYASETEEKVVYHTCKSRSCPSCGQRATLLWQREQWSALPDIPYTGIGLTMPDALWPIFQQNRHLLHDLPALAAAVIQHWVKAKYGTRALILVVPHSFGRHLNFNAHLHVLVSAGGLKDAGARWTTQLRFERNKLMRKWRYAVIMYLRAALKAGLLASKTAVEDLRVVLKTQYERWWNVYVDPIRPRQSPTARIGHSGWHRARVNAENPTISPTPHWISWLRRSGESGPLATKLGNGDFVQTIEPNSLPILDAWLDQLRK